MSVPVISGEQKWKWNFYCMILKTIYNQLICIIPSLILPTIYVIYFLILETETKPIGCSNCTYFKIYWDVMILLLLLNGLFFLVFNKKGTKKSIPVLMLTVICTGVLIYMNTFHIFVSYDQWFRVGMAERTQFFYNNKQAEPNLIFSLQPLNNIFIRIFAPKGEVDIWVDLDKLKYMKYKRNSLLAKHTIINDVHNGDLFFALARLIDEKTQNPASGIIYTAVANDTGKVISGQTDGDGFTEPLFTPKLESITFIWSRK